MLRHFIPSRWLHPLAPLMRLFPVDLPSVDGFENRPSSASFEKLEMSKTGRRSSPQTGKWESKEFRASQGRKNRSAVDPAPEKGMEQVDQAERRSCLAER